MKAYNTLIFDQTVNGTTPAITSHEFAELLGKADDLVLELEVTDGAATTITVEYMHSNSGRGYDVSQTPWNATSLASLPLRQLKSLTSGFGALGLVRVTLAGGTPIAHVRIWACGRTH